MPYVYRMERLCTLATPLTAGHRDRFRVAYHPGTDAAEAPAVRRCADPQSSAAGTARTPR
jgi:hypothetical protein